MDIPENYAQIQRMLDKRVKQLGTRGPVLAATLVRLEKICGHTDCRCRRGEKHIGHHLTFKEKGKTRTIYVPIDMIEEVRCWIEENRRVKELMREITQLSIAKIRGHVKHRQSKTVTSRTSPKR